MEKIRFGLLGYGDWGQQHARAIYEIPEASLVAVSESDRDRRKLAEKNFGVKTYSNYEELIAKEQLDIIDIVLPHYLHYKATIDGLQAGNNVLLEKPMALTVEECDQILKLLQKNFVNKRRIVLVIGYELRVSPLWGGVKKLIQEGKIGTPKTVNIEIFRSAPYAGLEGWRLNKKQAGLWLLDAPGHYIDLIQWYFEEIGKPQSLYSVANTLHSDKRFIGNLSTIIKFPNNRYTNLSFTTGGYGYSITAKIIGEKGAICSYWKEPEDNNSKPKYFLEYGRNKNKYQVPIKGQTGESLDLKTEIEQVMKVLQGGECILAKGWDGREVVRLCLASKESLESGKIINL